jgi:hypothetical protein
MTSAIVSHTIPNRRAAVHDSSSAESELGSTIDARLPTRTRASFDERIDGRDLQTTDPLRGTFVAGGYRDDDGGDFRVLAEDDEHETAREGDNAASRTVCHEKVIGAELLTSTVAV